MSHRPNFVFRIIVLMIVLMIIAKLMPDNNLQRQVVDAIVSSLSHESATAQRPPVRHVVTDSVPNQEK